MGQSLAGPFPRWGNQGQKWALQVFEITRDSSSDREFLEKAKRLIWRGNFLGGAILLTRVGQSGNLPHLEKERHRGFLMSEIPDNVDLGFLARQLQRLMGEVQALKIDLRETRQAVAGIGRSIDHLRDDLVTTVKVEIGGAFAGLETRLEAEIARIREEVRS